VLQADFTVAETTPHSLVVSESPNRASPIALSGATLSGRRYVYLAEAGDAIAGLSNVAFYVDGKLVRTQTSVPYDAFGNRRDGSAMPFDTKALRNGKHRITAVVNLSAKVRVVYTADFQVAN